MQTHTWGSLMSLISQLVISPFWDAESSCFIATLSAAFSIFEILPELCKKISTSCFWSCQHSQAVYNQEAVSQSKMIERLLIKDKNQCSSARKTCSIKSFASQQCSRKYSLEIDHDVTEAWWIASKPCFCLCYFTRFSLSLNLTQSCNSVDSLLVHEIPLSLSVFSQSSLSHCSFIRCFTYKMWQGWEGRVCYCITPNEMALNHFRNCWHLRTYQLHEGSVEKEAGLPACLAPSHAGLCDEANSERAPQVQMRC